MRRRFIISLSLGLWVASCDKPGTPDSHKDEESATLPVRQGGHRARENAPTVQETFRMTLKSAEASASSEVREKTIADVAWNALELDPEIAREAFERLPAGHPEKVRLAQHFAMRLAERSPDEALVWAETLGTESEIAAAKGQIALVICESDPQRAANLLSESGILGHEFDVAVVQVLQRWASQSAPDAAAWAISFPPGAARAAGISLIVSQWAETDTAAAFNWMRALEDGPIRGEAFLAMEKSLLQKPQEVRDAWLQHGDSKTRRELEEQRGPAMKEIGDNVLSPVSRTGNSDGPDDAAGKGGQ